MPHEIWHKLDDRDVKCCFVRNLARLKGWKFWNPVLNEFLESAHAQWLDKLASNMVCQPLSQPLPDPPSDIRKLLNSIDCNDVTIFLESLSGMAIDDRSITETA